MNSWDSGWNLWGRYWEVVKVGHDVREDKGPQRSPLVEIGTLGLGTLVKKKAEEEVSARSLQRPHRVGLPCSRLSGMLS